VSLFGAEKAGVEAEADADITVEDDHEFGHAVDAHVFERHRSPSPVPDRDRLSLKGSLGGRKTA